MNKKILQAINTKLNSDFKLIKQFGNGNSNKNYLLENSQNRQIVVKKLDNQPVEFVPVEISIQKHLFTKGVPTPQILSFNEQLGSTLSVGQKSFTHTEYIESDDSLPSPFELGLSITQFHLAMGDFKSNLPPNWLHPTYWKSLKFREIDAKTAAYVKNNLSNLRDKLTKLKLPKTVIHGDFNLGNILTQNSKIVAILDLESTEYNFRILEIGMSIFQVKPSYTLTYQELAREITKGYTELIELTDKEVGQIETATL